MTERMLLPERRWRSRRKACSLDADWSRSSISCTSALCCSRSEYFRLSAAARSSPELVSHPHTAPRASHCAQTGRVPSHCQISAMSMYQQHQFKARSGMVVMRSSGGCTKKFVDVLAASAYQGWRAASYLDSTPGAFSASDERQRLPPLRWHS